MEVEHGRLFVGGVSQETSEETLKEHFSRYGEVKEYEIIKDRITGNGKGFGFVTFADPSVVNNILRDTHIIKGRRVEVKEAKPKGERNQNQHCQYCICRQQRNDRPSGDNSNVSLDTKKIFVGGLPSSLTEEELKQYFDRFGAIINVVIMYNREDNTPRGFGFVTFDTEEAIANVLQRRFHKINDKFVEVKRAEPKGNNREQMHANVGNNAGLGSETLFVPGWYGPHPPYDPHYYNHPYVYWH